jgi:hypothetical protein
MFPASMISPVVDPASPASASAGPITLVWAASKSNSEPAESFFLPNGRTTNARAMGPSDRRLPSGRRRSHRSSGSAGHEL